MAKEKVWTEFLPRASRSSTGKAVVAVVIVVGDFFRLPRDKLARCHRTCQLTEPGETLVEFWVENSLPQAVMGSIHF